MNNPQLVAATPEHLDICMRIIADGKEAQRAAGFSQWSDAYPDFATIEKDIRLKQGWLLKRGADFCAYFSLAGEEPLYDSLQGLWRLPGPYRTLHRLAVAKGFGGQGLGQFAVECACNLCRRQGCSVLRSDTAEDNQQMRKLLQKTGFAYAGKLPYGDLVLVGYEKAV